MNYQDEEAERLVVGLLLRDASGAARALAALHEGCFTVRELSQVFVATKAGYQAGGKPPGAKALLRMLADQGVRDQKLPLYGQLAARCRQEARGSGSDLRYLTEHLLKYATGRNILAAISWGHDGDPALLDLLERNKVDEAADVFMRYASKVREQAPGVAGGDYLTGYEERMKYVLDRKRYPERYARFYTGIAKIDRATGGLQRRELGMISAQPGVGKTTMLVILAASAWQQGFDVFFATFEVPRRELEFKVDARVAGLSSNSLRRPDEEGAFGRVERRTWRRAVRRERARHENRLWIAEFTSYSTVNDVEAQLAMVEAEHSAKFDVVLLDHLGLMTASQRSRDESNLDWKIQGQLAYEAKFLALRRDVAVWAAVQERVTKTGKAGKGLGRIGVSYIMAQAADVSVGLERVGDDGVVRLEVLKGRFGGVRVTQLIRLDGERCEVLELEQTDEEGDE